jgi:hypothetical protein
MAQEYSFAVIATDRIGGMPGGGGDDPGKGSLAAAAAGDGKFVGGFEIVKGEWNPIGFFAYLFDTEAEARAWLDGAAGTKVKTRYGSVNLFRLKNQ